MIKQTEDDSDMEVVNKAELIAKEKEESNHQVAKMEESNYQHVNGHVEAFEYNPLIVDSENFSIAEKFNYKEYIDEYGRTFRNVTKQRMRNFKTNPNLST